MLVNISPRASLSPSTPEELPSDLGTGAHPRSGGSIPRLRAVAPAPKPDRIVVRHARLADMAAIEPLIRVFSDANLMLPKTQDQLARHFREFLVAVDENDRLLGCGALRVYNESLAEIASLAVDEAFQGMGIGRMIVERLLDEARGLDLQTVFALTLKPEFFDRFGFAVVSRDRFPLKVWSDCRGCPKLHACDEITVAIEI